MEVGEAESLVTLGCWSGRDGKAALEYVVGWEVRRCVDAV